MAICICAFHKIADGATLYGLANAWAKTAQGSSNDLPEFVSAAKYLPPPIPHVSNKPTLQFEFTNFYYNEQSVSKLFTFDASTITSPRAKAVSDDVPVPTRVEAPLPDHCVGNVVGVATACKGENDDGSDSATLVNCIRKSFSQLSSKYVEKQSRDEAIFAIPCDFMEITERQILGEIALQLSSLCGYNIYVDFDWGKPSWVSSSPRMPRNNVQLMETKDCDGIDAWICLKDKDAMSNFQQELELQLLPFGSVN
ncbi:stemmadenine O-acetyltransferase-like [Solanum dulcamara]|uniref:stemmadenine O-acetyltransferase-like n=1 Tax=Solanum dulcamara TaxID=45834 RepID=UPI00248543CE|nr:stemmadenine O-acetyltransferase-like [Solanum dulcamara]